MSVKRLADYLEHIRQAAGDACQFVQGMDKVGASLATGAPSGPW